MIPTLSPCEIERFYSKIRLGGCGMIWAGPVNNRGYGRFEIYRDGRRVRILAHRLAYRLANGQDPAGVVRHGCDTPPCCTPDCLEPGTQLQNVHDAVNRGRFNGTGLLVPQAMRAAAAAQRLDIGAKPCSCCKTVKALADFGHLISALDGRMSHCKSCRADEQRRRLGQRRQTEGKASA
jgi:hypothetical protein